MEWRSTKRDDKAKNVRKSMLVGSLLVTNEVYAFPVSLQTKLFQDAIARFFWRIPSLNACDARMSPRCFPEGALLPQ
jgi:hypothetical protein